MAESSESEACSSTRAFASSEANPGDEGEPSPKRRKEVSDKLEDRLGGILCCAVCLDLPQAAVYQCTNGHLMCELCFTHLLADASLRKEGATCPNCRVDISKTTASRNLAVEKTVSELPLECKFCTRVFPRHSLLHHETNICEDRIAECRFGIIGCGWRGPSREVASHEEACPFPSKPASDIIPTLLEAQDAAKQADLINNQILDLLSNEHITFTDLQLKAYRTSELSLYYESSRFSAFGLQWVVKAFVNTSQRDPTQSAQREITYQLALRTKTCYPLSVQWVALREPHGDVRLRPRVQSHCFTDAASEAPPAPLPLEDPHHANQLLAAKAIHFRIIMFQG